MERWDNLNGERVESEKVDAFIAEIVAVCKRHGMSISHEDGHGGFLIGAFNEDDANWLASASIREDLSRQGV